MLSDPSVKAMTDAQWLFEFHALKKKEDDENMLQLEVFKTAAKVFRNTLIGVLGLDLIVSPELQAKAQEASNTSETPAFTPAVLLMANHHLLHAALDEMPSAKKSPQEDSVQAANDAAFEEFSQRLARGDTADMDPILVGPVKPPKYWELPETQQMLAALGVQPRAANAPAVPHFTLPSARAAAAFADGEDGESDMLPVVDTADTADLSDGYRGVRIHDDEVELE